MRTVPSARTVMTRFVMRTGPIPLAILRSGCQMRAKAWSPRGPAKTFCSDPSRAGSKAWRGSHHENDP